MKLDKNGYGPSLVNFPEGRCFICGRSDRPLQRHEVFHGPYRSKSKAYGCWVNVCYVCHSRIHANFDGIEMRLKGLMQKKVMLANNWTVDQFREVFGKSFEEGE